MSTKPLFPKPVFQKPAPRPASPPASPTAAPKPASLPSVRQKFGNEFSSGQGSALRRRALATTGASTLRTEVRGDGRANCLERASELAQPGDQVMLLGDADGVGHAIVVRSDGTVLDPNDPQRSYESVDAYLAEHHKYTRGPVVPDRVLEKILSIPPGPQRDLFIAAMGLTAAASRRVADPVYSTTNANLRGPDGQRIDSVPAGTQLEVIGSPTPEQQAALDRAAPGHTWLLVRLPDGSEGFIAQDLTSGTAPTGGAASVGTSAPSRGGSFSVGTNYTDIGTEGYGMPTDEAGLREAVADDFNRLQAMGVTDVRVWAMGYLDSGQGLSNDPHFARMRLQIVLEEAARRGMNVTIDVRDLQRGGGSPDSQVTHGSAEEYQALLDSVIGPAVRGAIASGANLSNMSFSIGNEPAGPADPSAFADWYVERANLLRGTLRDAGLSRPKISAELIPGSVGKPPDVAAMRRIIAASDSVSIHFYAPGEPDPANEEYQMLRLWQQETARARKPFVVGEFGVDAGVPDRDGVVMRWIAQMQADGIAGLRLWQFGKDETTAGHMDDRSLQGIGTGLEQQLRGAQLIN